VVHVADLVKDNVPPCGGGVPGLGFANIVHQDVDTLETIDAGLHDLPHIRGIQNVAVMRCADVALCFDRLAGLFHGGINDIDHTEAP
jgi:hypothetical protein